MTLTLMRAAVGVQMHSPERGWDYLRRLPRAVGRWAGSQPGAAGRAGAALRRPRPGRDPRAGRPRRREGAAAPPPTSRRARCFRRADDVRGRADVLRPGPARFRARALGHAGLEGRHMNASAVPGKVALVIGAGRLDRQRHRRRFAREGYIACLTRRSADKLRPAVDAIRAAGGRYRLRQRRARRRKSPRWSSASNASTAPSRCWCSTSAPTCPAASSKRRRANISRSGRWPFGGFPQRPRGRAAHGRARPRHHPLHGCDRIAARVGQLRRLRGRQSMLRALAQSMARELGPKNIHVAHRRRRRRDRPEFIRSFPERYALKEQGGILDPAHIADNY